MVQPVPEGFHTVTPYLTVKGCSKLLEFTKQAFGAQVTECLEMEGGMVGHAQVRIGDSNIMMGEVPAGHDPMPGMLYLYLEDVDAAFKRAMDAGGECVEELNDKFYGDRSGGVKDPCGNVWYVATHVEDVPPEEIERRAASQMMERDPS